MKMDKLSHKNSIWTWSGKKASIWLPYLQKISKKKKDWVFEYNGGEVLVDLKMIDSVLFYGASCDLPLSLLDDFNKHAIVAILHRRGISTPYVFHPLNLKDTSKDLLTQQILFRENEIKRNFISKSLIRERIHSMSWLIGRVPTTHLTQLRAEKKHSKIVAMEASYSKRYWGEFAQSLGVNDWQRRSDSELSKALDACSYFMVTIILRWILFHKLSPAHSYLHKPTTYASLAYDLIEPYRYMFEQSVYQAYKKDGENNLIESSILILKEKLEEQCYVPTQHGYVRRKNLLHGIVLSLRAYLLKESRLIVIPTEGDKKVGRPVNSGFVIPGKTEKLRNEK